MPLDASKLNEMQDAHARAHLMRIQNSECATAGSDGLSATVQFWNLNEEGVRRPFEAVRKIDGKTFFGRKMNSNTCRCRRHDFSKRRRKPRGTEAAACASTAFAQHIMLAARM